MPFVKLEELQFQMLKSKEIVYVPCQSGYEATFVPSDDPAIITALKRNVTLSYRVCNEIWKGSSKFLDPAAEEKQNTYCLARQKNDLQKSQATMDCSQVAQVPPYKSYFKPHNESTMVRLEAKVAVNIQEGKQNGRRSVKDGKGFPQDLEEVVSETEIETADGELAKLRKVLAEKDNEIARYKQEMKARTSREQMLQRKLKMIKAIAESTELDNLELTLAKALRF